MAKTLTVKQPNILLAQYEIYDGDTLVAQLKRRKLFKKKALAYIGKQGWEFTMSGLLGAVEAMPVGATSPVLTYGYSPNISLWRGQAQIGGATYTPKFAASNGKGAGSMWVDANNTEAVAIRFKNSLTIISRVGIVEVSDSEEKTGNYIPLTLLTLFMSNRSSN